jgi:hypothetical protein
MSVLAPSIALGYNEVDRYSRLRPRRNSARFAARQPVEKSLSIWLRPELCTQTNSTVFIVMLSTLTIFR